MQGSLQTIAFKETSSKLTALHKDAGASQRRQQTPGAWLQGRVPVGTCKWQPPCPETSTTDSLPTAAAIPWIALQGHKAFMSGAS